jgi:hypothetical protein
LAILFVSFVSLYLATNALFLNQVTPSPGGHRFAGIPACWVKHGGIQPALVGIKLPFVQDPDGHLLGFYVIGERPVGCP